MADERKSYVLKEGDGVGTVKVAEEVVAVIAGLAATEVRGVASLAGGITNQLVSRKGYKALSKGVKIGIEGKLVAVELTLNLDYGYSIPEVGGAVQQKVKSTIETMTGLTVTEVVVNVADIAAQGH